MPRQRKTRAPHAESTGAPTADALDSSASAELVEAASSDDGADIEAPAPTEIPEEVADVEARASDVATDEQATDEEAGAGDEPPLDEPALDVVAAPTEALPSLIEALLFVSDGPVELRSLARALGATVSAVEVAIEVLRGRLESRGLILQTGPEGAQLVTAPIAAPYVEAFLGLEAHRRLSNAALETLAIVAYRQPVTRSTIDAIRGVSSDGAMQTLRARGLIEESGRSQGPGRATLFVTTQRFLEHFGLNGTQDLPDLGDIELPPPDSAIPLPGFNDAMSGGVPQPAAGIAEVADALTSLSAAARALTDPERRRPGATALLLPGPQVLSLPSPGALPDSGPTLPTVAAGTPWE